MRTDYVVFEKQSLTGTVTHVFAKSLSHPGRDTALFPLYISREGRPASCEDAGFASAPAPIAFDSRFISPDHPCLITGATGFLGNHLLRRLIQDCIPVRLAVRDPKKLGALARCPGVEVIACDLRDPSVIDRIVSNASFVFHCAGMVSDWGKKEDFEEMNVQVTKRVAEACLTHHVQRLIHVSTTDIHGYPGDPMHFDAPHSSGFPYGDSKWKGERAVLSCVERGLSAVLIRPATIIGPGSISIVKEFVAAFRNKQMFYIAEGAANAGFTYVENVVDAMLCAARHPAAAGRAYDLTDDIPVTWKDFTLTLAHILGVPHPRLSLPFVPVYAAGAFLELVTSRSAPRPLLTRMAVNLIGKSQAFSIEDIKRDLGYTPRVGYAEAMGKTAEWILDDFPRGDEIPFIGPNEAS